MKAKQIQVKHWQKCQHPCPHKTTLEMFWHRSGIKIPDGDETAIRVFRLEIMYGKESRRSRFARYLGTIKPDYSLAA